MEGILPQFDFVKKIQTYLELSKWRVVSLMLVTSAVGMSLAPSSLLSFRFCLLTLLGIGLTASASAALNHLLDRRIDALMSRTLHRPLPQAKVSKTEVALFSFITGSVGLGILSIYINLLTCTLSLLSLIGYAFVYTLYLKHHTSQNIVIGGLAGAMPPLLGWTAVTGHVDPEALVLVLIIFTWTPPHFWSLSIARHSEYVQCQLPMLSVTHGIDFTKRHILLYTILLNGVSLLPFSVGFGGFFYLGSALLLNGGFILRVVNLLKQTNPSKAIKTFHYSNVYLLLLFSSLLLDHYLRYLT